MQATIIQRIIIQIVQFQWFIFMCMAQDLLTKEENLILKLRFNLFLIQFPSYDMNRRHFLWYFVCANCSILLLLYLFAIFAINYGKPTSWLTFDAFVYVFPAEKTVL